MKIKCLNTKPPQEEGYFFLLSPSGFVDFVHIIYYPPREDYGISWEGYFGISNWRGRNVLQFSNFKWSEKIEVTD